MELPRATFSTQPPFPSTFSVVVVPCSSFTLWSPSSWPASPPSTSSDRKSDLQGSRLYYKYFISEPNLGKTDRNDGSLTLCHNVLLFDDMESPLFIHRSMSHFHYLAVFPRPTPSSSFSPPKYFPPISEILPSESWMRWPDWVSGY